MRFSSKAGRLTHPYAKQIPFKLWISVFRGYLPANSAYFFETDLEVLLQSSFALNERPARCAAVILLIRSSNKPDKRILQLCERLAVRKQALFQYAAACGSLPWLSLLYPQDPATQTDIVKANNYAAFRDAAMDGHLPVLQWLAKKAPHLLDAMIQANNYDTFRWAANNGHLPVLQWLADKAPHLLESMIQANDYLPFRWAAKDSHLSVSQWLLQQSVDCLAFVERHVHEYGDAVALYISSYLEKLRQEQNSLVAPPLPPEEARRCFYMIRHLIRRNRPEEEESIRFLLSFPAVAALAHQAITPNQPNELLRLALTTNNQEAAQALLEIAAVRQLAQANNYYADEQRGGLDLRALAQDRESSMTALTPAEQERLAAVTQRYSASLGEKGVDNILAALKQYLLDSYAKNPATLVVDNKKITLPASWEAFQQLSLKKQDYGQAIAAYAKHPAHTAWRYLSQPNPWMHPQAGFVKGSAKEGYWADFEGYKELIALLWLAACDEKAAPTQGWTLQGRIDTFVSELAFIGRAHNWDKCRLNAKQEKEEYDDGELDRPSCYSGMKRRLFQSVKGHALMTFLTEEMLKQELRDVVCAHFDAVLAKDPSQKQACLKAYADYILGTDNANLTPLAALNLSKEQEKAFLSYLTAKYGAQFDEKYQQYIQKQFTLDSANAYHAITLDGLTHYWENQYTLAKAAEKEGIVPAINPLPPASESPEGVPSLSPPQAAEQSTEVEEVLEPTPNASVSPLLTLDNFLQELRTKTNPSTPIEEQKKNLLTYFNQNIHKLCLADLKQLLNCKMRPGNNDYDTVFNTARYERKMFHQLFGDGNTKTWRAMVSIAKTQLIALMQQNATPNPSGSPKHILAAKEFQETRTILNQHACRGPWSLAWPWFFQTRSAAKFDSLFQPQKPSK